MSRDLSRRGQGGGTELECVCALSRESGGYWVRQGRGGRKRGAQQPVARVDAIRATLAL